MKKIFSFVLLVSIVTLLSGCALGSSSSDHVITIYSDRHYDTDQAIYDTFEAETGIAVNVVKASADELINRLQTEGEDTEADLLMIADAGRLHKAKEAGLFQAVSSDTLVTNIPDNYRDSDNLWFGLTKRARVLVYHPDRVSVSELSTYEDLADPKWEGRIVVRSSANIYNQSLVASLIELNGEEPVETWISHLTSNFARDPEGNDRDQAKAVMAGEADIAIMNTYYMGKMANSADSYEVDVANDLAIFFPNQDTTGTHINVSGAGVTAYSDNVEDAIALIEYLSGEAAQFEFANANYEYPVNPAVEPSELLQSWGSFTEQQISLTQLGLHSNAAAIIMDEQGWK
ncbi:MAG: Fe(3+) ABC transporter substrate-binding protein [Candidatus Izimaplasma sp.]|nr:Fe(3+) ABC transporter substrate-binding protein [Candidatus Izimaplasma bacterium]